MYFARPDSYVFGRSGNELRTEFGRRLAGEQPAEADVSTIPGYSLEDLERQTDVTVVAQCANKMQYTLSQAICKGDIEANTRDGQMRVRWEGMFCEELSL